MAMQEHQPTILRNLRGGAMRVGYLRFQECFVDPFDLILILPLSLNDYQLATFATTIPIEWADMCFGYLWGIPRLKWS